MLRCLVISLLSLLPCVLTDTFMQAAFDMVVQSEMPITLMCNWPPLNKDEDSTRKWTFKRKNKEAIVVCALKQETATISASQFSGRADCFGNGTLRVNKSQAMDGGSYTCLESRMLAAQPQTFLSFNVSIYKRPTGPSCHLEGDVVPRGNVSLTCEGATGWPNVTYGWLGADGERVSNCAGKRCTIYDLSSSHDGMYTCLATNAVGNSTCKIELKITTTRDSHEAEHLSTIIAVSFTIGFILILICLAFIFRRRRKQSRAYARPSVSRQPSQPTAPVDIHEDGLTYAELDFGDLVPQDHPSTWQLKK